MTDDERGTSETAETVFSEAFDKAEGSVTPDLSAADDPANQKDEVIEAKDEPKDEPKDEKDDKDEQKDDKGDKDEPADKEVVKGKDESEEAYKQRYKTLQGIHRHEKEQWDLERAELTDKLKNLEVKPVVAAAAATDKDIIKEAAALVDSMPDDLTDEQKAALAEYENDFDVVSQMEGLKRERELRKLRKEIDAFKESLRAELTAQLQPAQDLVKTTQAEREMLATQAHFDAIRKAHEDFETHRDSGKIREWILSKPKYMQKSMLETYEEGTADDVIELIADFKQENTVATPTNVVNMKRQNLTAVTTRRGAVNTMAAVANDFDGAFDEAANKGG